MVPSQHDSEPIPQMIDHYGSLTGEHYLVETKDLVYQCLPILVAVQLIAYLLLRLISRDVIEVT